MTHTPTPWKSFSYSWGSGVTTGEFDIAQCSIGEHIDKTINKKWADESASNAAYIVQCVNAHDELVKALEKSIDGFTYGGSKQGIHNSSETAEFIRNIYLKAKGTTP